MAIPAPDATHGPSEFWFRDTADEAEKLVAELRTKHGSKKVVPPPSYSTRLKKYVITCVDVTTI